MLNSACQGRPGVARTCRTLPGPTRHESEHHDHPRAYAVDGALYYAKYLKEEYNVIAVGISGTSPDALRVDAYYWSRQSTEPIYLQKCRDVCLEPAAYLDIIRGRKLAKKYSIEQIRQTAQSINARLREAKVTEKDKPIFVAGILIALEDEGFAQSYERITTFGLLFDALMGACGRVLGSSGLPSRKVQTIARAVERMREYPSLRSRRLGTKIGRAHV